MLSPSYTSETSLVPTRYWLFLGSAVCIASTSASVVFAACLVISVHLRQNRVLTTIGGNVSLFRSIAREIALLLSLKLQQASYNMDARALRSFIALRRFAPSCNK